MGLFERLERDIKAEMNNSLNNTEKELSKLIRDMEGIIVKLSQSITQLSSAKKLKSDYDNNMSEIKRWEKRAWLALYAGEDNLAKEALLRKHYYQTKIEKLKPQIKPDQRKTIIADLQKKLTALEIKVTNCKKLQTKLESESESKSLSVSKRCSVSLEQQFSQLEASSSIDITDNLAAIKAGLPNCQMDKELFPDLWNSETTNNDAIDDELEELRAQLRN